MVPSNHWLDDPATQVHILRECHRQINQGIAGRPFNVFQDHPPELYIVHDFVDFFKTFGKLLEIHSSEDPRFNQEIANYIFSTALQREDNATLAWVNKQCQRKVICWVQSNGLSLPEDIRRKLQSIAPKEVCQLVEDGILPLSTSRLIDIGVCKALQRCKILSAADAGAMMSDYRAFEAWQYLLLALKHLTGHYDVCITKAVLKLPRKQQYLLAITYGVNGSLQPIQSCIDWLEAIRALDSPHLQDLLENLPQTVSTWTSRVHSARHALCRLVTSQFEQRIGEILQNPAGWQKMGSVCRKLWRLLPTKIPGVKRVALTDLETMCCRCAGPKDIEREAQRLTSQCLSRSNLAPRDYGVIEQLVSLRLAVQLQEAAPVPAICGRLCETGIPDPGKRLFTCGVQMLDQALNQA
jgi:hypothetical protein